ncbi:MAG TPA: 4Fe-4S ferredoxin [Cytophagales bacterium]|nr:4Fe-4S ferredoxin [Cytophagales bacterium]HAA23356.1 4Fe-4S ferredoxin [Cytophagales bacterium]HAP65027.1 4Fe-4S ferredoxin [Cytophagales bacterium]
MTFKTLIKSVGLVVFLGSLGLWVATLFLGEYRLTTQTLEELLGDETKAKEVLPYFSGVLDQTYTNKFAFIGTVKSTIKDANTGITDKYQITEAEIDALAGNSESEITFALSLTETVFAGEGEVPAFKRKIFADYGGWLDGRAFASSADLRGQIEGTVGYINADILKTRGIDKYTLKAIKVDMIKRATVGFVPDNNALLSIIIFIVGTIGALMYILPKFTDGPEGIKHNGIFHSAMKSQGWLGILTGSFLIGFYILLYWYAEYITEWTIILDPLSMRLSGNGASQWFLYGFLYTVAVLVMGIRMYTKYRHSKYQLIRTTSVMFFQTAFAFIIPEILVRMNQPYFDFKNIWPLDYDFFFSFNLKELAANGGIGVFMLGWGIALILVGVPVFTYFFGKRWYCSWVCGCGGLAETLGDPYRQLSDKSLKAWKVERILIHSVLVFAVVMTSVTLINFFTDGRMLGSLTEPVQEVYGFAIGSAFAGVIGTGFYPLMGNRMWCRFGCPLAAYLGIVQKFKSRFRITTNGGQCISCGNCSTYCEMGIDVRWYAQRGQNIIRSSCVGCGVCSQVCPRGVLKLENKEEKGRFNEPILIGNDGVKVTM